MYSKFIELYFNSKFIWNFIEFDYYAVISDPRVYYLLLTGKLIFLFRRQTSQSK